MRINLNEMVFFGYHGVHPEERKLGQRFIVDFSYETDYSHKRLHHISDTVDYSEVFDIIKNTMENEEHHLLENCANSLLDNIFVTFPKIIKAYVCITKPSVPIKGILASIEVEVEREREDATTN
ncbi:MAG: dihydroneopterin aldolase [Candidatus Cloacimonetes bacterium]|nr:dihydroneopterin aldolase [Candidatus Cloacimonadota bacterium]